MATMDLPAVSTASARLADSSVSGFFDFAGDMRSPEATIACYRWRSTSGHRINGGDARRRLLILDVQRPRSQAEHFGWREQRVVMLDVVVEEDLESRVLHRLEVDVVAV